MNNSNDNKRIAKNTILLYIRLLLIMVVTLYTSRIVLKALGASDFGIYNVVGGVISLFSVISGSMSSAASRFFTYELGLNNERRLNEVFSASLFIFIIIIVFIFILSEIVGVWFLNNKMNIPNDRLYAANWVLQCAIISFCFTIFQSPFNAAIIAHERMDAFAWFGIIEACLKLMIAFSLLYIESDLLIAYSIFYVILNMSICLSYVLFGIKKLKGCNLKPIYQKDTLKSILGYSGWSVIGSVSYAGYNYGYNIILNLFFDPVVNAARGIAVQVQNAIVSFSNNLQASINPQIIKNYASGNMSRMHDLVCASSKYSFFLLFAFSFPVYLEAEYLLDLWLVDVPPHTINFVRLMLVTNLIDCLGGPMTCSNQATGNIKWYQILTSTIIILSLPLCYYSLKSVVYPEIVFVIYLVFIVITQIIRCIIVLPSIKLNLIYYSKRVLLRIFLVSITSVPLPFFFSSSIHSSFWGFIVVCIISFVNTLCSVYLVGLNDNERGIVNSKVCLFFKKLVK